MFADPSTPSLALGRFGMSTDLALGRFGMSTIAGARSLRDEFDSREMHSLSHPEAKPIPSVSEGAAESRDLYTEN